MSCDMKRDERCRAIKYFKEACGGLREMACPLRKKIEQERAREQRLIQEQPDYDEREFGVGS